MSDPGTLEAGGREAVLVLVETACATLEASRSRIDDLNVFPVPDGDTGTNMARTAEAVAAALRALPPSDGARLAEVATRAALMGARGNSGIILSQVVRGAVGELAARGMLDGAGVAAAFAAARDAAYAAVGVPVEGTMLTVIREMALGAELAQPCAVERTLELALAAGEGSLARTPQLLPRLREAGVVDAGGAGLVELLRGLLAGLRGEPAPAAPAGASETAVLDPHADETSRYRYCTSFLVEGPAVQRDELERQLAALGDSILVVGTAPVFKVHVHTDDPGGAIRLGTAVGTIGGVEVADMHEQMAARLARLAPERACDVVFVSHGAGNRALAASLGARAIVDCDPSTEELVRAIDGARARGVIVLPNDPSALLAAQSAAAHATRPAHVLASRSIAEGVCALVAYLPEAELEANVRALSAVLADVRSGQVSRAVRSASIDGIEAAAGSFLALANGRAVAALADPADALRAVAEALLADGGDVLTVLLGDGEPAGGVLAAAAASLAAARPGLEVAVHEGGQTQPLVLLALE
jgi:DAK2 domain fusion protein YloV